MSIIPAIADAAPVLTQWRRQLHTHPELAFEEHSTAAFIASTLATLGIEVHRGLGGTGVVGTVRGARPGISIGFRADMDALPMNEENDFTHRSQHAGRAHACGHDGHVVALLGLAQYLSQHPPATGTVQLIFQPAEETASGAQRMIDDGLFERFPCDEIYAFHNMPLFAPGTVGIRPGPVLTGYAIWQVDIEGVGGHGAAPHKAADPLQAAARLAIEISAIVGRFVDPMQPAVISACSLHAGTSYNVIPSRAELSGTLRGLSQATQDLLLHRLCEACAALELSSGCKIACRVVHQCPPCVNADGPAKLAQLACADVVGAANVLQDHPALPFTDDFSHLLEQRPGAYLFIGQSGVMCHHATYDFDDALLPIAASIFACIVQRRLNQSAPQ
ncbi:amidohydrolase [Steroidobacter sp.]|uniref:amidohydrolase n=1 Tax=Steroidobacter sp. TaxID=1978227 RepID=UPI001A59C9EB|nr:amidohydrolase [Steroidobacter sp.]MBL8269503.1 amidohydrolase [Steroidobacter sp.]